LAPGEITFVPFAPLGFRLRRPHTAPIHIAVLSVSSGSRRAQGIERWWFSGIVFEIETTIGKVEWGFSPATDIVWATNLVSPPSSTYAGS